MNAIKYLFLALLLVGFSSCSEPKEEKKEVTEQITDPNQIVLIDGVKWKVNPEMAVHVTNMESRISTFSGASQDEFIALADFLQTEIGNVTSKCTMKGQSHDELHKWLLPYIENVKALSKTTTVEEGKTEVAKLKTSLETYNIYFQ